MSDFPAVDANESATGTLQDCDAMFKAGVDDTTSGTYNYDALEAKLGYLPDKQRKLYLSTYQLGRYGEYAGWGATVKAQWPGEAGRATAMGLDDALAGRPRATQYTPKGSWASQDAYNLNYQYQNAYDWGQAMMPGSFLNMKTAVIAGLVFAAAVAGTVYLSKRKESAPAPVGQQAYANPAEGWRTLKAGDVVELVEPHSEMERDLLKKRGSLVGRIVRMDKTHGYAVVDTDAFTESGGTWHIHPESLRRLKVENPSRGPGMTVQSLLFNREAWDLGPAKRWAKSHDYRTDDVDVKPNTIRMRQADPKHFQKKTMRTIQFGEDSGIQAIVARPKR